MPRFTADEKLTFRGGGAMSAATEAAGTNKLTVALPAGLYQVGVTYVKTAAGVYTSAGDRTTSTWLVNDSADNSSFATLTPQAVAGVINPSNLNGGTAKPEYVLKGVTVLEARPYLGMSHSQAGGSVDMTFTGVFIYLITRSGGAHAQHLP
jgi:hypothetical protein